MSDNVPMEMRLAMRALLAEPEEVRERLARKLDALARAIGDRDRSKFHAMMDISCFLRHGTFIPPGASRDPVLRQGDKHE
jgi:hypothetical protein